VDELSESLDDENFLIQPTSLVADSAGNIFVFDKRQVKIFKYDKNLKLVKTFGKKGQGPSEFGALSRIRTDIYLYIGKDNYLYVGDRFNLTIHCFDLEGNFIKDIRMRTTGIPIIVPVMDKKRNFYLHTGYNNTGLIDVFNDKGERTASLLEKKELGYGLFFKPDKLNEQSYYYSSPLTVQYYIMDDDRLIVICMNSGFLYILKNNRLLKKLELWPKKALTVYKKIFKQATEKGFLRSYFFNLIHDKDNKTYFYLDFGKGTDPGRTLLYRFDLSGNLKEVFYVREKFKNRITRVYYKKNNLFYAIGSKDEYEKTIILYKEGNKK
jgi:hypothetical protein